MTRCLQPSHGRGACAHQPQPGWAHNASHHLTSVWRQAWQCRSFRAPRQQTGCRRCAPPAGACSIEVAGLSPCVRTRVVHLTPGSLVRITASQQVHGTRLSAGRVRLGCKVGMPGCEWSLMLRLSPAGGWRPSMRRFEYEHGSGTPATQVGHQSSAGCPPDSLAVLIASPAPSVLRAAPAAGPAASETASPPPSTAPCGREPRA